ncbi:unnamed protein product [Polarella glacialis]|uniref:UBC core domain-containing protein n=1 Tax=Polarella glacialis TaxID=89957 RepID=A0A813FFQ1_POLGL|nr:unnamed protein product [Polarella glacialis]
MELAPGLMPTVGVARPWSDPLLPFLPMPPIPPVEPMVRTASAIRELRAELKLIQERIPQDTCHVDLVDCDLFEWEVSLAGPDGTPYRGGTFHFLLRFPADYPIRNPSIQCMTPMYHCNIDRNGSVCMGLPEPGSGGVAEDRASTWTTAYDLIKAVYSLLVLPVPEGALVVEAAHLFHTDRRSYNRKAEEWTMKYAT